MAALVKNMDRESEKSSSSDDEALRRCQEAVWETRPVKDKEEDSGVKDSKRVVVADHEHDGNELQVSQGFRTHVAKKLGHLLDSYISETQMQTPFCVKSAVNDEDSDEVSGQTSEEPPAPARRRPVHSSSDSDSEMETRLREAAVSISDLLSSSTLPSTLSSPSTETPSLEKVKKKKKAVEGEENHDKKKKKRQTEEDSAQVDSKSSVNAQSNRNSQEQEHTEVKLKRKKKKRKREEETVEDALN